MWLADLMFTPTYMVTYAIVWPVCCVWLPCFLPQTLLTKMVTKVDFFP